MAEELLMARKFEVLFFSPGASMSFSMLIRTIT